MPDKPDITGILLRHGPDGDLSHGAIDEIFEAAYEELHALAGRAMQGEQVGHTLQPTALLNEAYVRLVDQTRLGWESRAHFFGVAARAMRQVLVDHARRRNSAKRGGGWERVTLEAGDLPFIDHEVTLIELADALTKLAEFNERMARVVELRVFAGLSGDEIGRALGVSRKTVTDDWRVAAMWLRAELSGGDSA